MTRASSKCGFTLIELLVVIAIIAVPAATLLLALATWHEAGFITDGGAPPSFHNSLLILQKRGESSRGGEGYDN